MRVTHISPHLCHGQVHLGRLLQGVELVDATVKMGVPWQPTTLQDDRDSLQGFPFPRGDKDSRSRTDQSPTTPVSRWSTSVSDSMESWKADHSDCTRASRRLFASLRGCVMAPRC